MQSSIAKEQQLKIRQNLIGEFCYEFIAAYAQDKGVELTADEVTMIAWQLENPRTAPGNSKAQSLWAADGITLTASTWQEAAERLEFFEVTRAVDRIKQFPHWAENRHEAGSSTVTPGTGMDYEVGMRAQIARIFQQAAMDYSPSDLMAAIRASIVIMAVPLSPVSVKKADFHAEITYRKPFSVDSVTFLNQTVDECPEIYPVYAALTPTQQALVKLAFFPAHMRHMLYLEGNQGMFSKLKRAISNGELSASGLAVWYLAWVANCISFNLHKSETTWMVVTLFNELSKLMANPAYDVLAGYLQQLVDRMGLSHRPEPEQLKQLAVKFAVFFDKVDLETGRILLGYFNSMAAVDADKPKHKQKVPRLLELLLDDVAPTPTYVPGMFRNLLKLAAGNITEALNAGVPVLLEVLEQYHAKRELPASFMLLARDNLATETAAEGALQKIWRAYRAGSPAQISLNDKMEGVVTAAVPAPRVAAVAYPMVGAAGAAAELTVVIPK